MFDESVIFDDITAWVTYEGNYPDETFWVYRRCECGMYLKQGQLLVNLNDEVKLTGWICKKCGEIEPFHILD